MRYVVFDLETKNTFNDVGKNDPALLDISVAGAYDSELDEYFTVTEDALETLWPIFEKTDILVGYNSNHFDIPLLNKYYPGDLTQIKSVDILENIRMSFGKRLRLDAIAQATLGTGKSAHGLQAVAWWKEGKIDEIKKYCQKDVEITKNLFEYIRKHGRVKYKDGLKLREIPIDTSDWWSGKAGAITHSLPF